MIYIKKYQNSNSKMPKAYGKWYGRIIHTETVDLEGLCEHIASHGTIFTADVVAGTVKKFVQCIQELLLEGKKVKLDGIGTFYLALQTTGAETLGDFSVSNVKGVRLRFLADQSGKSRYTTSVLTRQAKLTSTLPGAEGKENDDDDDNSPQQGGGTSGSVEEQP
jgi:predicted histone-like DNA-binding protein